MSSQPENQALNGAQTQLGRSDGRPPSPFWAAVFSVEVRAERDRVRVAPVGELDLATAGPLETKLREVGEAGFDRLVIDLRRLTFIDCTGLRVLLQAHARADESGRELTVLCGPGQVMRVLALTGADRQLDIVPDPFLMDLPAAANDARV